METGGPIGLLLSLTYTVVDATDLEPVDILRIQTIEDSLLVRMSSDTVRITTVTDVLGIQGVQDSLDIRGGVDTLNADTAVDSIVVRGYEDELTVQ